MNTEEKIEIPKRCCANCMYYFDGCVHRNDVIIRVYLPFKETTCPKFKLQQEP